MSQKGLESYFSPTDQKGANSKLYHIREEIRGNYETFDLPPSYLVSADYSGSRRVVRLKLYDPKSRMIYTWYDNTGHKPYLLTNLTVEELKRLRGVVTHPGLDHFEPLTLHDPLRHRKIHVTKVVAKDPLSIGGRSRIALRDLIPREAEEVFGHEKECKIWESYIKYYQSYIYDKGIIPGTIYEIRDGNLISTSEVGGESSLREIRRIFSDEPEEFLRYVMDWARLLELPAPDLRRVAFDIEVSAPVLNRIPDPREASFPVISAAVIDSDGGKRMLLLEREGIGKGSAELPQNLGVEFYSSERDLIYEIFNVLNDYPFVLTFNGDDFDLRYLFHRALNLGFKRDEIPIEVRSRTCHIEYGVHLDLYRFFFNRSIQTYAFRNVYQSNTLDDVGRALVGKGKIDLREKMISDLTYSELARYCYMDAEILMDLSRFDDNLIMKLILALTRISKMPMEDVSRQGVSRWIRSLFYYEHRRKGFLIPNKEDILYLKGSATTKAIIKGKKFKGAIVVKPKPGVHFNVLVLDFASLYPSIIKGFNLGYQTILCPHPECRSNRVPGTTHWICTKERSLESLLIGSLKDLRVRWYKPRSKKEGMAKVIKGWYDVIQRALKVILNASYGVFGAESFDLYCPPVAESTAALGREAITKTIGKAEELGIEVIYGDTDSIFLKEPTEEQVKALIEWSESDLKLGLEVDKIYRYAVFSSRKKNYLGVFQDGSIDAKGLTGIKRHIPPFIEKAFEDVLEALSDVRSRTDFEKAKRKIERTIKENYRKLKNRDYKLEDLAYRVVLGKPLRGYVKTTPQHVKAALLLRESGKEVEVGDIIKYVKTISEVGVKPLSLASIGEVDVTRYTGDLRSTFTQILDAMGMDFDEIIGITRLERFM